MITWSQLGIHRKNIGLLNVGGYFDALLALVDHSINKGFVKPSNRDRFVVRDRPAELLTTLGEHRIPQVKRWLGPEQS